MEIKRNVNPFNNSVESGLRILTILNEAFPKSFDLQNLVYLDYLTIHSGDIDKTTNSLHPAVPYRSGEIMIRSSIIEKGLNLFISKKLIEKLYNQNGIEYKATENAMPFLESLEENYSINLQENASWTVNNFSNHTKQELKTIMTPKLTKIDNEFNIEILQ
ncbi:threonine transporter [Flavobacterium sp. ZT3R18]|uniref:ABC-three component system middle component 2 n=1 Tax=Flavobacterium sp. ZT3R18 TaxID=2594429 RepID=UPI001179AB2E|nr:ABC-three component system middle component 2 [Flavobacterium sp. ZT3R18]TRX34978.1 threonine transporter [Flavobacterium sp. ZT3R18]